MLRRTLLALPTSLPTSLPMSLPMSLTLVLAMALPAEAQPACETTVAVGKVRVCDGRRDTAVPSTRAPRAWQPVTPRTLQPTRVTRVLDERWPTPTPATSSDLPRAEPAPVMDRGPAAWRQPTAPRVVPVAWRQALAPQGLMDAHRRVREGADAAARWAVIDEVARTWALTVDQVICLVGALPRPERLAALTRLHGATSDASAYERTYHLLDDEQRMILHVRITRPFDAATAARRARLERLRQEERELQRVLGE